MPTSKHRYNITFNPNIESQIQFIAKSQGKSFSRVVQDLTEKALEIDEDAYLCKLVEENEKNAVGEPIPAEKLWKELGFEE